MSDALNSRVSQSASPEFREHSFVFSGGTFAYFKIWIVNILLSIITIGIYSAWAKVRRLRYFYQNTSLDGYHFNYHAEPFKILIGRLIVVGALILYNILVAISPFFTILLIGYIFLLPVIINASFSFSFRMTSFRDIRFGFKGDYWPAFGIYVLLPLAVLLTGGLALPFFTKASWRYIGSRVRYGAIRAEIAPPLGAISTQFGLSILVLIITMIPLTALPMWVHHIMADEILDEMSDGMSSLSVWHWLFVSFYFGLIIASIFYRTGTRNVALSTLVFNRRHRVRSFVGRGAMIWITLSNFVVILLTLGLAWPWAEVRRWRYQAAHFALLSQGPLDNISGMSGTAGEVTAAEFTDIEGFDFGL